MNARELIEALGAGDPDAEVYMALPGEGAFAPLESIDDVSLEEAVGDVDEDENALPALVLWPAESRRTDRRPAVGGPKLQTERQADAQTSE